MENIKASFNPTQQELQEVEKWLIEEDNKTGEGFYCNWNIIASAYENGFLAVIVDNKSTVGFAVWQQREIAATIVIAEIAPKFQKKGYGKILIEELFKHLIELNICTVDLECSPPKSESYWRRLGFIDFPEVEMQGRFNRKSVKGLYKIIVPSSEQTIDDNDNEIIELWDCEPQKNSNRGVTWKWELLFKKGTRELIKPIIHPGQSDWRIIWRKNDEIYKDGKVKYFGESEIYFDEFIVIRELPEITYLK